MKRKKKNTNRQRCKQTQTHKENKNKNKKKKTEKKNGQVGICFLPFFFMIKNFHSRKPNRKKKNS